MHLLIWLGALAGFYATSRMSPGKALLWLYIPVLLIFPDTFHAITPGLPDPSLNVAVMMPLFFYTLSRYGRFWRPSVADVFHGEPGAYRIGEAAGWISPSSAEGYSYAFTSAAALAKAILKDGPEEKILRAYQLATLSLMGNIIFKQAKSIIMFSPFLRQMVMHSGVLARV